MRQYLLLLVATAILIVVSMILFSEKAQERKLDSQYLLESGFVGWIKENIDPRKE